MEGESTTLAGYLRDAAAELAEISQLRRTDRAAYNRNEALQARERDLLSGSAFGTPPFNSGATAELEEISHLRRTDPAVYLKRPDLQARELELLADEEKQQWEALDARPANQLPTPAEARKAAGRDFDEDVYRARWRAASDVLVSLSEDEAAVFRSGFERMSEAAQLVAIDELASRAPMVSEPTTERGLAEFSRTSVGAALVREWGADAGRRLGVVRERMYRMLGQLSARDGDALGDWLDGLSEASLTAVLRKLAT